MFGFKFSNAKKVVFSGVLLTSIFLTASGAFAKIGDAVGSVYSTDIIANIDGMPINSYNIGGRTAIIAEELSDYGFDVVWKPESREIVLNIGQKPDTFPNYINQNTDGIGKEVGKIYETDIKAYVNGMPVESYNVGGRTALVIEDMGTYDDNAKRMSRDINPHRAIGYSVGLMSHSWDGENRKISLYCLRPQDSVKTNFGEAVVKEIKMSDYHHGQCYIYADADSEPYFADMVDFGNEVYFDAEALFGGRNGTSLYDSMNLSVGFLTGKMNIKNYIDDLTAITYDYFTTRGACSNNVVFLETVIESEGNSSKTETSDTILYDGKLYVGENALNSAMGQDFLSYSRKND